jgi:hypothetical protein
LYRREIWSLEFPLKRPDQQQDPPQADRIAANE